MLEWGDTFLGAVDKNIKRRVLQLFTCSIPTKFQNFDQISQCLQNFTILPNFIISQAVRSMKPKLSLQNHWKVILCLVRFPNHYFCQVSWGTWLFFAKLQVWPFLVAGVCAPMSALALISLNLVGDEESKVFCCQVSNSLHFQVQHIIARNSMFNSLLEIPCSTHC